ncbi:MAG: hypothetical protein V1494_02440 [Candidatus Diapherotrites archaeon]
MAEKMFKVNCDWCKKEIECPEGMMNAEKHACFDCFMALQGELGKMHPAKLHIDAPRKELEEKMPEMLSLELTNEVFPKIWGEEKENLKKMQKKELAKTMFATGAAIMLESLKKNG